MVSVSACWRDRVIPKQIRLAAEGPLWYAVEMQRLLWNSAIGSTAQAESEARR